jgi:hypothetical protein
MGGCRGHQERRCLGHTRHDVKVLSRALRGDLLLGWGYWCQEGPREH